ncbi:hypothetical protein NN561_002218 [Cricetulus griseus]
MLRAEQTQLDSKKAHGEKSLPYAVFDRLVHLPGPKGLSRQLGVSCGTFRGSIWTSVAIRSCERGAASKAKDTGAAELPGRSRRPASPHPAVPAAATIADVGGHPLKDTRRLLLPRLRRRKAGPRRAQNASQNQPTAHERRTA